MEGSGSIETVPVGWYWVSTEERTEWDSIAVKDQGTRGMELSGRRVGDIRQSQWGPRPLEACARCIPQR
jgi:carbohydrate-selective porin OprB